MSSNILVVCNYANFYGDLKVIGEQNLDLINNGRQVEFCNKKFRLQETAEFQSLVELLAKLNQKRAEANNAVPITIEMLNQVYSDSAIESQTRYLLAEYSECEVIVALDESLVKSILGKLDGAVVGAISQCLYRLVGEYKNGRDPDSWQTEETASEWCPATASDGTTPGIAVKVNAQTDKIRSNTRDLAAETVPRFHNAAKDCLQNFVVDTDEQEVLSCTYDVFVPELAVALELTLTCSLRLAQSTSE